MFFYAFLAILLGVAIGIYIERYRWVRASRSKKSIGVDGLFYRVKKFNPDKNQEG